MRIFKPILITLLYCKLLCVTQAATIVQTLSNTQTTTDWSYAFTFQKFDDSLGTLDLVTVQRTNNVSSVITINNNSLTESAFGSPSTEVIFSLSDPGNHFFIFPSGPQVGTPAYNLLPGQSITFSPATGTETGNGNYSSAVVLSEFTGTGTI